MTARAGPPAQAPGHQLAEDGLLSWLFFAYESFEIERTNSARFPDLVSSGQVGRPSCFSPEK